jgi:hypothetical protein
MIQLISNFLLKKNHDSFYAITYSLGQFDETKSYESFKVLKF